MNYETLFLFIMATASLAIAPGPDNIYVLAQSITNGKKYGLATVAGLISGCLVHTTFLAIGISAIIKANGAIYYGIRVFGALYLLYLAFMVWRDDAAIVLSHDKASQKSLAHLFGQGFVMNVLNPKVTLFFLAFFPGFLFSDSMSNILQFYILGLLFMLVSGLIFSALAMLAGSISNLIKKNGRVGIVLKWGQIFVFVSIAAYLVLSDK